MVGGAGRRRQAHSLCLSSFLPSPQRSSCCHRSSAWPPRHSWSKGSGERSGLLQRQALVTHLLRQPHPPPALSYSWQEGDGVLPGPWRTIRNLSPVLQAGAQRRPVCDQAAPPLPGPDPFSFQVAKQHLRDESQERQETLGRKRSWGPACSALSSQLACSGQEYFRDFRETGHLPSHLSG